MAKEEKFEASREKKYEASTERKYLIMFKENRTFEMTVGRQFMRFEPHGQKEVSEAIINHPDFKQQKQFFAIREL